jgi:membrane carboxypeptidase/penicillin-binding protein PbpC
MTYRTYQLKNRCLKNHTTVPQIAPHLLERVAKTNEGTRVLKRRLIIRLQNRMNQIAKLIITINTSKTKFIIWLFW